VGCTVREILAWDAQLERFWRGMHSQRYLAWDALLEWGYWGDVWAVCVCTNVHVRAYMCVHTYISMCYGLQTNICIHIYMYIYICVCVQTCKCRYYRLQRACHVENMGGGWSVPSACE